METAATGPHTPWRRARRAASAPGADEASGGAPVSSPPLHASTPASVVPTATPGVRAAEGRPGKRLGRRRDREALRAVIGFPGRIGRDGAHFRGCRRAEARNVEERDGRDRTGAAPRALLEGGDAHAERAHRAESRHGDAPLPAHGLYNLPPRPIRRALLPASPPDPPMKILVASDARQPNEAYRGALLAAGALPEEVHLVLPGEPLPAAFDGLLLAGGPDVDPSRYGETPVTPTLECRAERDALDFGAFASAEAQSAPVFGICRGLQVVNVALGGTLWQDLPSQRPRGVTHDADEAAAAATSVRTRFARARCGRLAVRGGGRRGARRELASSPGRQGPRGRTPASRRFARRPRRGLRAGRPALSRRGPVAPGGPRRRPDRRNGSSTSSSTPAAPSRRLAARAPCPTLPTPDRRSHEEPAPRPPGRRRGGSLRPRRPSARRGRAPDADAGSCGPVRGRAAVPERLVRRLRRHDLFVARRWRRCLSRRHGVCAADAKKLKTEIARTTKNKPVKWIAMTHLHSDSNDGFLSLPPTAATVFVNARATGGVAAATAGKANPPEIIGVADASLFVRGSSGSKSACRRATRTHMRISLSST